MEENSSLLQGLPSSGTMSGAKSDWGSERMRKRQTHRHMHGNTGLRCAGLSYGDTEHSGSSCLVYVLNREVGLLHTAEQGCSVVLLSIAEQGSGFSQSGWEQQRSRLQAPNVLGETAMVDFFCSDYRHSHTDQGKVPLSCPSVLHLAGKAFAMPTGLRHGVLDSAMPMSTIYIHLGLNPLKTFSTPHSG